MAKRDDGRTAAEQRTYFKELEDDERCERTAALRRARSSVVLHGSTAKARKPQRGRRRRRYWR